MELYRRVTVLCTVKTFRSTCYSSQNKGHKTFKSSHNRPEDYVYHSIRDAALTGIACSETPVPVSVFWLAMSRMRAARPQQHLLEAVSSLHYS